MISLQGREKGDSKEQDAKRESDCISREQRVHRAEAHFPALHKGDVIPSSIPLETGDLGFSLLSAFRSSLPLCSTEKNPKPHCLED